MRPASVSQDIIEIQPCTEEGLVTLEARLGGKDEREILDPVLLCRYLNAAPVFENPRCSPEMGYGMLEKDGRKIHVFKTGKVIVRRAEGREQALGHLHLASRTIWPALRVDGGDAIVVCLGREKGCARFAAPPSEGGELSPGRPMSIAIEGARRLPLWRYIEESAGLLLAIAKAYPQSGVSKATREEFRKAEGPAIRFIAEVREPGEAATGILVLAASLFLDRAMQACEKLPPEGKQGLWHASAEAFEAVISGESEKAGGLKEGIMNEGSKWGADVSASLALVNLLGVRLPG